MASLMKRRRNEALRPFGWENVGKWISDFGSGIMRASQHFPRIETSVRDGHFVVKADLPGLRSQDVEVYVEEDRLVIKGERKSDREVRRRDFHRRELFYGSFERSIPLPEGVKAEGVKAKYHGGVLEIKAPYEHGEIPRKIDVHVEKSA